MAGRNSSIRTAAVPKAHFLNIGHSNAQSLSAHITEIQKIVRDNNINVMGISETHLKPSIASSRVSIPNFNLFRVDRVGKKWGGVALYVHESIKAKEVCRSDHLEIYRKRPEFLFLELSFGRFKLLCGTIYGPNNGGFWSDVEEAMININSAYDYKVIMGDFNINWASDCSTRNTLADSLVTCGLERLPYGPTNHEVKKNGHESHTMIDYICVSNTSMVRGFHQAHVPHISNHDVIFASFEYAIPKHTPVPIRRRSYRNFNLNNVLGDLGEVDWDLFDSWTDVDSKVGFLTDAITHTYDRHAPIRVFTPRKPHSPWLTAGIKRLITARNNAWRICRRGGGVSARARYKSLRNLVQNAIRNARFNFYKAKLNNCTSTTELWRIVNELGITTTSAKLNMPADPDSFNGHFTGSIAPVALHDTRPTARISTDSQFYFRHVDIDDIISAFAAAHSNAIGPDEIPLRHLKECLPVILRPLINIFDTSLQSGYFPSDWKKAIVRPLPKLKAASTISDFRPISILCAISKIFEFVALKQMTDFISDRGLLDSFQSGFRKGHSTHTALICVVDDLRVAIDEDRVTLVAGIDLTQAFDRVNIKLFIDKLRFLGFSDSASGWIESFLSDRSQVVKFDNGEV